MNERVSYINNSTWLLKKLNDATLEIQKYLIKIEEAKAALNEYSNMIHELEKLGYYTSVSACARNLMKQADLIVEYQKQINHIQRYINELFE